MSFTMIILAIEGLLIIASLIGLLTKAKKLSLICGILAILFALLWPIIDQKIPAIRFFSGRTLCHRRGRRNGGCPGNDNLYLIVFIRKYLKMILCHIFFQRKRPDQFLCLRIKSCKYCDQIAFPSLSKMCLAT